MVLRPLGFLLFGLDHKIIQRPCDPTHELHFLCNIQNIGVKPGVYCGYAWLRTNLNLE